MGLQEGKLEELLFRHGKTSIRSNDTRRVPTTFFHGPGVYACGLGMIGCFLPPKPHLWGEMHFRG
jgi:hypothetical protein